LANSPSFGYCPSFKRAVEYSTKWLIDNVCFFSSVFTIENDDDETLLENIQYDKHSNNDNFTLTEVNKLLKENIRPKVFTV
jgi:hypothetical protein